MERNRIVVLSTQSGDWEALYVNGELIEEGHHLGEGSPREFWLEMYNKYNFTPKDIVYCELNDIDEEYAENYGSFHGELDSFNGKY